MENRALGKGLSALIPDTPATTKSEKITTLPTKKIKFNPLQPRKNYDDGKLAELVSSIKEKGVLQPILVREKGEGYEVVAGERRLRAALALNLEEVPAMIKAISDQDALVIALVENIQREELNPIEEAEAFRQLIENFAFTQDAIAKSVGKERSTVTNLLRLLKLPADIQQSVAQGVIAEGHARALLGAEDEAAQRRIFEHTIKNDLSVREVEELVRKGISSSRREKTKSKVKDYNIVALEESLQQILGTRVTLQTQKKGGKLVIEYYSNEDLDRIIATIKK